MADWNDLSAEKVRRLLAGTIESDVFNIIWPNVMWVAQKFWTSQSGEDQDLRNIAWHHLVMSAGNFKRQAGRISLFGSSQLSRATLSSEGPLSFRAEVKSGTIEVHRDISSSWASLTLIDGLEVATASTLMSAIWPDFHFIIDRRDLNAAIGLMLSSAEGHGLMSEKDTDVTIDWGWYLWMREMMLEMAVQLHAEDESLGLLQLERSLYLLDQRVKRDAGSPPLSYRKYSERIQSALDSV